MKTRSDKISCPACYKLKPILLMREHVGRGEYVTLSVCRDCQSTSGSRFLGRKLRAC